MTLETHSDKVTADGIDFSDIPLMFPNRTPYGACRCKVRKASRGNAGIDLRITPKGGDVHPKRTNL